MSMRHMPITRAVDVVAQRFGIHRQDIMDRDASEPLRSIRSLAMLVARHATGRSYQQIGRIMDGRDHTAVITGVTRARVKCRNSRWTRELSIELILRAIEEVHMEPPPIYRLGHLPSVHLPDADGQAWNAWNISEELSTPEFDQLQPATVNPPQEGSLSPVERIEA